MNVESAVMTEALRLLHEGLGREPDAEVHPTPEALLAYRAGELPAAEELALQEHFARCPHCPGLLLDVKLFLEPDDERPRSPGADPGLAAAWRRLRARLVREGLLPAAASPGMLPARWLAGLAAPGPARIAWVMSLFFLLTTIGLSVEIARLTRGGAGSGSLPAQEIEFAAVRGSAPDCGLDVPDGNGPFALVVNFSDLQAGAEVRLEARREGRIVWASPSWTVTGPQSLSIPRDWVPKGTYTLRLAETVHGRSLAECEHTVR